MHQNYQRLSCEEFVEKLSSKAAIPGGGSAAALSGALGAALANMVGNLTLGKKKYQASEREIKSLMEKGEKIYKEMLDFINKDAQLFEPLSKAYGLGKDNPEQIEFREKTIEKCAKEACRTPMMMMERSLEAILIQKRLREIGTKIAISDVGCGVTLLKSTLIAARLNLLINFKLIKDENYLSQEREKMEKLFLEGARFADETLAEVTAELI